MKKITKASKKQWEKIKEFKNQFIDDQTKQYSFEECVDVTHRMYKKMDIKEPPLVFRVQSPLQILQFQKEILKLDKPHNPYISIWLKSWSGWYQGAQILGVEFEKENLSLFLDWCRLIPVSLVFEKLFVCCENPKEIHWKDAELHNEKGQSVTWNDGTGFYSIEGVLVDEQIVLRPETQTIEQINNETNEEVRRIRLERYGISRYLKEAKSEIIDTRSNDIEGTEEVLVKTVFGKRLYTNCKTGKKFLLSFPNQELNTCEEVQKNIWGDRPELRIIGRS